MSIKSHAGTTFARHLSNVERFIRKIDHLRALKIERDRLLDKKDFRSARKIEDRIYNIECQDELDIDSCKAVSENTIGTC